MSAHLYAAHIRHIKAELKNVQKLSQKLKVMHMIVPSFVFWKQCYFFRQPTPKPCHQEVTLPYGVSDVLLLDSPWLCFINGFPIKLQPFAKCPKPLLEDWSNHPFFGGPHIEKIISSITDSLHQFLWQRQEQITVWKQWKEGIPMDVVP